MCKTTLETSGADVKLHSKRVYFSASSPKSSHGSFTLPKTYADHNAHVTGVIDMDVENTLETSGEEEKLDSKPVEKIKNYTRNEWRRCEIYTRNEWRRLAFTQFQVPHSCIQFGLWE
jgi:hypothetical protein